MSTRNERSSSNGSPGTTPTPPPASGLQTEEGTATRPRASSSETPANQGAGFDPSMMEKFFSFMSFYEQHQQGVPAQSNNSNNNNNVTPMSLDGSSYARGNQQQQPTFAPYEPQRGSVSFMQQPQPAPGQERTLDALQVQSQFAHVLKLQTTKPFDGKDFFTWSFEFELMMEGAQILGFFDGTPRRESLQPNPTYAAIAQSEPSGKDTWFLDSCCGQHMCSSGRFVQREHRLQREVVITVANNQNLRTRRQGIVQLQSRETNVILQMSKEFKLYHGKGGLYIGKAVLKNNVFVLDFVPDLGTADSDAIVNFADWTHPPDLDPDFSPEGFWYSHTIPEAERTRALVTIQHSAAAETTSAPAETTSAAVGTTRAAATTTPVLVDETPPTPAQQLHPAPREVHRSANFIASFYSNSDIMRKLLRGMRLPNHQWPAAMDHAVMLHNLLSSSSLPNNASPHLLWTGKQGSTKMLRVFGCMVQYRPPTARAGRFSQRAQWGLHLGIEKNYNAWKIFDVHSKETVAARDVIFNERLTLQTYLANLQEDQDPTGGFRGNRAFTSAEDEADWDEQNVNNASEEAGPLPFCSVDVPMDDDNPCESVNAETFYHFADNGYVTPATVNTNQAE
ncbi:unnamed protein product [Closterium sp. NIES-54]